MRESDCSYSQLVDGASSVKKERLFIAVVSTGQSGHMNPMLNICKELCKRGHQVTVYTEDFAKKDFEKKIKQTGSEGVFLDMQGNTLEDIKTEAKKRGSVLFLYMEEIMLPALEKEFAKGKPDVVLADFATLAGASASESFDIPLLINVPGPLRMMRAFLALPDATTGWKLFGFFMQRQRLNLETFAALINIQHFASMGRKLQHHVARGAVMLVHTIWGLDQPAPVFPNLVMTGPVLPPAVDLREQLAKEHVELHRFLRESDGPGAVYDVGVAELIGKIPGVMDTAPNPYKEGWMTEDTVYSAVSKVMRNPSYTEAAQRFMRASQASGGVAAAAQQTEWAGWYGTAHLKPVNFKNFSGSNPWTGLLLAVVAGVGAAVLWTCRK
eukprot:Skav232376  [mRNA]  locus=scaffold1077:86180:88430:+ [translate_table: standard]